MSTASGRLAEAAAVNHLKNLGYDILDTNWRTKWCEVDIVAKRRRVLYFCEVKYRLSEREGGGLDYITPQKLAKMRLGANSWVHLNKWHGEYQLMAIEVSGSDFLVSATIEDF